MEQNGYIAPNWAIEQALILAAMLSKRDGALLNNWHIDTLAVKLASGEIKFEDYTNHE